MEQTPFHVWAVCLSTCLKFLPIVEKTLVFSEILYFFIEESNKRDNKKLEVFTVFIYPKLFKKCHNMDMKSYLDIVAASLILNWMMEEEKFS